MQSDNRRKYFRLSAHHLARYRILPLKNKNEPFLTANIKNIGAGGVCFLVQGALPVPSLIEMKISFPALAEPVLAVLKLVRIKELRQPKMFEAGAQFVTIDETLRRLIDERINAVSRKIV